MALTKKDIQLIKDSLQPQFDGLRDSLRNEIKKVEVSLTASIQSLKIYVDARFAAVDSKFDKMDKRLGEQGKKIDQLPGKILSEMHTLYAPKEELSDVEKRVSTIEYTLSQKNC